MAGIGCRRFFDVGVAGLHRLLAVLPELTRADALIVKSEFENAHLLETVRRFVEIGA